MKRNMLWAMSALAAVALVVLLVGAPALASRYYNGWTKTLTNVGDEPNATGTFSIWSIPPDLWEISVSCSDLTPGATYEVSIASTRKKGWFFLGSRVAGSTGQIDYATAFSLMPKGPGEFDVGVYRVDPTGWVLVLTGKS